jgi:hypothetical protein
MKQLLIKYLFKPLGFYVVGLITLLIIVNVNIPAFGLAAGYFFGFPLLTVVWWVIAFSRSLYNNRHWESIPFLLANLATAFGIGILGFSFGIATIEVSAGLGLTSVLIGILGGFGWFIRSVYQRITSQHWRYDSIHMQPLEFQLHMINPLTAIKSRLFRTAPTINIDKPKSKQKQIRSSRPKERKTESQRNRIAAQKISSKSDIRSQIRAYEAPSIAEMLGKRSPENDFTKISEEAFENFGATVNQAFAELEQSYIRRFASLDIQDMDEFYDATDAIHDEAYDKAYQIYDQLFDKANDVCDKLYDKAYEAYDKLTDQTFDTYLSSNHNDEWLDKALAESLENSQRYHRLADSVFDKQIEKLQDSFDDHINDLGNTLAEQRTQKRGDQTTQGKRGAKTITGIFRTVSDDTSTDSSGVPIPPRSSQRSERVEPSSTEDVYRPQPTFRLSFSTQRSDFITEAKKHVNRTEKPCDSVPFMQYWPTYSAMNKAQQQYYFYWRTQLRQGVRLPADTSYLFVYIYEVINMVGFDNPRDAFDHLVEFWGYYRKLVPKLDNYLPDWIADFIVIHNLPIDPLKWYGRIAKLGSLGDEDLLIEAWLQSGDSLDVLSNDIIFRIADYDPTMSKFYKKQANIVNLDDAYKKGIEAVDEYVKAATGKPLFELYQSSRTRNIRRRPFASAVHEYTDNTIQIATVHFWYGNEALGDALKNIVKHTENIVREQNDYRYKLRDIDLDPKWKNAIETAFNVAHPKRKIEIDLSDVAQLQKESETIRQRLTVDDNTASHANLPAIKADADNEQPETTEAHVELDISEIEKLKADSEAVRDKLVIEEDWLEPEVVTLSEDQTQLASSSLGYLIRPDDAPKDLLTDITEVAVIMGESTGTKSRVIAHIMINDWQCSTESIQSILDKEFANVIIDEINEAAIDQIGDSLIFEEDNNWVILEEYRDEVQYILEHPEYQKQVLTQNTPTEVYAELEDEWAEFTDQMESHYWDVLAAILSGEDVEHRVDAIASRYQQTGNILIDAINEISYETIGDILIDTAEHPPVVVEDEIDNMKELLNWAVNRQLIEV